MHDVKVTKNSKWEFCCIDNIPEWCDLFCLFKLQNSRKLKFIEHPSHLHEYIDTDNCGKMPGTTLALEEDLKVYKDALKLSHKDTKVALKVTAYFANLFSWIFKILFNNKNNLVHFNEKKFQTIFSNHTFLFWTRKYIFLNIMLQWLKKSFDNICTKLYMLDSIVCKL